MTRFVIALLIVCAVGGTANAEPAAQTPENAHKFLLQLASQNRLRFEPPEHTYRFKSYSTSGYNNVYRITSYGDGGSMSPLYLNLSESAGCQTKAPAYQFTQVDYKQEDSFYDSSTRLSIPGKETWNPWVPHLTYFNAHGIDWSKVSAVNNNEGSEVVVLRGPGFSGGYINLLFESPEMAVRGAFAMEVIRQACDPVASTGF